LLSRSSSGAKEWHFGQNSVFFHNVDELDTSSTVVVLTTNRLDLVDAAIVDRFVPYEFVDPPLEVLEQVARDKARLQGLQGEDLKPLLEQLVGPGRVRSLREVERLVMRAYVARALR
jgi:AAA+ superfamily predicted ATPase